MTAVADHSNPARRVVHALLPADVNDVAAPSGGNTYDRRICHDLAAAHGWQVHQIAVPGSWPQPDEAARTALAHALASLCDDSIVLIDGLVACGVPDIVVPHARRLRTAVLLHLPLAEETGLAPALAADLHAREQETLRAASALVVTSPWAARQLAGRGISTERTRVAVPGSDPAPLAPGTDSGSRLLCVAAVIPRKGQDLLIEALADLTELPWTCAFAGSLRRAPAYGTRVRQRVRNNGLDERVRFLGPLTGEQLGERYACADLVVLPSRFETYGMVVTEALRRGIPVLAAATGAVPETLGRAPDGGTPGLLVPPNDARALRDALRRWLLDPSVRGGLRTSAQAVRDTLAKWDDTARRVASVLEELRENP